MKGLLIRPFPSVLNAAFATSTDSAGGLHVRVSFSQGAVGVLRGGRWRDVLLRRRDG